MTYQEKIVDAITGEVTYRDYTPEEIAQVEAAKVEMAERLAKIEEAKIARKAVMEKLGLTADDLKALGL